MSAFLKLLMGKGWTDTIPEWIVSLCDTYGLDQDIVYKTYKTLGEDMQSKVDAFIAGESYIQTDRKCKWDTGVVPTSRFKVDMVAIPSSTSYWSCMFGNYWKYGIGIPGNNSILYYSSVSNQQLVYDFSNLRKVRIVADFSTVKAYVLANGEWKIGYSSSLTSVGTWTTQTMSIDGNGSGTTSKWYYVRLYDGTATTHLYIPYANNQFLDLATGELKTRTGTGTATYYAS